MKVSYTKIELLAIQDHAQAEQSQLDVREKSANRRQLLIKSWSSI